MCALPDELWRRILEIGVESSDLNYKDLCCLSISCRRLHRFSSEDALWSVLLSQDFPRNDPSSSNNIPPNPASSKSFYKIRFERDKARKLAAHSRAVLRMESQIAERSRKLRELQLRSAEETEKMKATIAELSNVHKARQASVALNVWQPEVIRGRQKQIVEQCVVPVEFRINALEMELRLCRQQIEGFDKAYKDEKRRLDASKERLVSMKYHPLQDYNLTISGVDERHIKRKKSNTCINFHVKDGETS
ncbi:hypothetical protein L1049_007537 [Liquidambar formosana]|uniref:F-box domain-containing protein n=1 Tax=Liquidambar formosana TaxID=63359 RepID=A0AAP0S815_LIQFO